MRTSIRARGIKERQILEDPSARAMDAPFMKGLRIRSHQTDPRPLVVFLTYTGIGDLVMALPLLSALRDQFRVLPVISPSHANLARLLYQDGVLEDYVLVEESLRLRRNPLGHVMVCLAISRFRPDVVVIYGKVILAYAARFGLLRARRVLYCHRRGLGPRPSRRVEVLPPTGNQTRDYLQFAERLGVSVASTGVRITDGLRDQLEQGARPLIDWPSYAVVAPWTNNPHKDAPPLFFRDCIDVIVREGRLPVVVTGLPDHRSEASSFLRGVSELWARDLVGATSLEQMLGCLAGARFVLANEGGTLHLARLVGTRAVVAFGPTAPEQRLLDFSHEVTPLRLGLSCSPCYDTSHRYQCPGAYLQCLRGLEAAEARSVLLAACQAPICRAS